MKTKFIAEMVGTMVLVLMGCGAAVLNGGATSVAAVLTIAFAFGLSVVAMAYTIGPVSGCHINPAITIGVWLNGGLSVMEAGRDYNDLHFIQCACRFTDTCTTCRPDGTSVSKRMEVKKMIAEMKKTNPYVEGNIFRSMENVNLDTVIGYKQHGVRHSFLEGYNFTSFS